MDGNAWQQLDIVLEQASQTVHNNLVVLRHVITVGGDLVAMKSASENASGPFRHGRTDESASRQAMDRIQASNAYASAQDAT